MDIHGVSGGTDPDPNASRRFICRLCAAEVFLYGLRDWWVRERRKAVLDGKLEERRDCPDGPSCRQLSDSGEGSVHLIRRHVLNYALQHTLENVREYAETI